MSEAIEFADFLNVDIRVGRITRAEAYPQAHKPAIKLWIDLGAEIGEKKSSAQLTAHYDPETLLGRQVMAVVNFPPRQIGKVMSEFWYWGCPMRTAGSCCWHPTGRCPKAGECIEQGMIAPRVPRVAGGRCPLWPQATIYPRSICALM